MNEQALKDRIQTISKEKQIHFNECWKQLLLERFLARLARSDYHQRFIFKGGFLLSYMLKIGRETTDLDFLLTNMDARQEEIKEAVQAICSVSSDDGFYFSCEGLDPLDQPHMDYPGYRVSIKASLGRMKDKIQIDVEIGDVVVPATLEFSLFQYKGKSLFEEEISLLAYPPETIFAEKLETALSKGAANSRMKDYHDLILLSREPHMINLKTLKASIQNTFNNRKTTLEAISFTDAELKSMNRLWSQHLKNLRNSGNELKLPTTLQEVIPKVSQNLVFGKEKALAIERL